tara:strand:+ start:18 stop:218 length:201 start_codon:yes stop_codon:yes gene_type:complete
MGVHQRAQKAGQQAGYLEVRPGVLTAVLDSEVHVLAVRVRGVLLREVHAVNLRHSSPLCPGCQGQP